MELTPQQEHILRNAINNHNNRIKHRSDKVKWQKKLITVESIKKDLDKGEKFKDFNDAIDYINYKTKTANVTMDNRRLAEFADPNSDAGFRHPTPTTFLIGWKKSLTRRKITQNSMTMKNSEKMI